MIDVKAFEYLNSRDVENIINVRDRRCKVRVIKMKQQPFIPYPWQSVPCPVFKWPEMLMGANRGKCSCNPGTACNNAACPHLPIITCAA